MTKPKWTLKWMFVSVLIIKVIAISANENTHYLPPLECYDPYGRPQVRQIELFLACAIVRILLLLTSRLVTFSYFISDLLFSSNFELRIIYL